MVSTRAHDSRSTSAPHTAYRPSTRQASVKRLAIRAAPYVQADTGETVNTSTSSEPPGPVEVIRYQEHPARDSTSASSSHSPEVALHQHNYQHNQYLHAQQITADPHVVAAAANAVASAREETSNIRTAAEHHALEARAAAAVGVDGFFFEVHEDPSVAKSDADNALPLNDFGGLPAVALCRAFSSLVTGPMQPISQA